MTEGEILGDILGDNRYRWYIQEEYRLRQLGYVQLGHGVHSAVFGKPGCVDPVIKLAHSHDAWPEYVTWANRFGLTGGLAPVVTSILLREGGYVAEMERLYHGKFSLSTLRQAYVWMHSELNKRDISEPSLPCPPEFALFFSGNWEVFIGCWRRSGLHLYYPDLSENNVMQREDGTLVLTDPFTSSPLEILKHEVDRRDTLLKVAEQALKPYTDKGSIDDVVPF